MLDLDRINRIVFNAATHALPPGAVKRVEVEPMANWAGDAALHALIVLDDGIAPQITGEHALKNLHSIQTDLLHAGEDRFAHLEYATEAELAAEDDDDSEP